jgi:hypothetical protein
MEQQFIQIRNKIYEIRGWKVMLDRDLAEMYQVETRRLNEVVKRNIKRFPADFMFQLTKEEFEKVKENLMSQNGTSSWKSQIEISNPTENLMSHFATSSWGGVRKLPYAFTEQGVAMLSGLLNSDVAIAANISIMRAFVFVRQTLSIQPIDEVKQLQHDVKVLQEYIEDIFADYNDINEDTRLQLELINQSLAELQISKQLDDKPRKRIGYI